MPFNSVRACPEDSKKLPLRGSWQNRQVLTERVLTERVYRSRLSCALISSLR